MLAPIALYPDSLLTHILIASTYPLEISAGTTLNPAPQIIGRSTDVAGRRSRLGPERQSFAGFSDAAQKMSEDPTDSKTRWFLLRR